MTSTAWGTPHARNCLNCRRTLVGVSGLRFSTRCARQRSHASRNSAVSSPAGTAGNSAFFFSFFSEEESEEEEYKESAAAVAEPGNAPALPFLHWFLPLNLATRRAASAFFLALCELWVS